MSVAATPPRGANLSACPPDASLVDASLRDVYLAYRFLPWRREGGKAVVACAAPSTETQKAIAKIYGPGARIEPVAAARLTEAFEALFGNSLLHDATYRLDEQRPEFSARRVFRPPRSILPVTLVPFAVYAMSGAGERIACFLFALLCICYLANIVFRVVMFAAGSSPRNTGYRVTNAECDALNRDALPSYSILVPLYREAHVVPDLIKSLQRLDYPSAKLEISLIFEADDPETFAAARALDLDQRFQLLRVPVSQPRTKPKACNYALHFCHGMFAVIYDAEDRPEPRQLLKAVAAFRALPSRVACLQARLNFYNTRDNWLTRMFTIEYAAWFDFLLPGLARFGFPIPLGGTSNHFRMDVLRSLYAWDAFNVTEDADLGIRLARCGYRVLPFDSTTYEEAVSSAGGWIRQRSRWLKGYMQTVMVHWRHPRSFVRAVGWPRFCAFSLFVGGAVVTNLFSPFFWVGALIWTWRGDTGLFGEPGLALASLAFAALFVGNAVLTALAMAAPLKRGWVHLVPYGITVFVYGLLISFAAYRALWQFSTRPFFWEKTEHGKSVFRSCQ